MRPLLLQSVCVKRSGITPVFPPTTEQLGIICRFRQNVKKNLLKQRLNLLFFLFSSQNAKQISRICAQNKKNGRLLIRPLLNNHPLNHAANHQFQTDRDSNEYFDDAHSLSVYADIYHYPNR